jgi:hypothetical protein
MSQYYLSKLRLQGVHKCRHYLFLTEKWSAKKMIKYIEEATTGGKNVNR